MLMLRLFILAMIVTFVVILMINRRYRSRCPECQSVKVKEIGRTTERIDLDQRGVPGVGSKVNVAALVSQRCHSCGHTWQHRDVT